MTISEKIKEKKARIAAAQERIGKEQEKSANIAVSLKRWKVWKLKLC